MKGWTSWESRGLQYFGDDAPVFTYVADGVGTCAQCHRPFPEGATVVRVGVTCCDIEFGWQQYHLDCYTTGVPCT